MHYWTHGKDCVIHLPTEFRIPLSKIDTDEKFVGMLFNMQGNSYFEPEHVYDFIGIYKELKKRWGKENSDEPPTNLINFPGV
jgi:hypothetical protein